MNNQPRGLQRLLILTAIALATPLVGAPAASAGVLVNSTSAENCRTQVLEQPFTRWLDYFRYTLVPGGSFESGATGWKLSRASVVRENESYYVRSRSDSRSLSLGASGSAQSAPVCVGIEHPVMRLFVRNRGLATSVLAVEVLFEDAGGRVRSLPIGTVPGIGGWQPSLPIPVLANLLALLPNQKTAIAFRFTATGIGGDWRIDDVYVDPHRRG